MSSRVKECKRFLWAIFVTVLLADSEAGASWVSPVTVNNPSAGDTIHFLIRVTRYGEDGFSYTHGASGGEAWIVNDCCGTYDDNGITFYLISNIPNVTLWSDTYGGSSSGWRAHFEILDIIPAPQKLTALNPGTKERAQWWSDGASEVMNVSGAIVFSLQGVAFVPGAAPWVRPFQWLFGGMGLTAGYLKQRYDRYVNDPPVPCPGVCDVVYTPSWHSPEELGLPYCDPADDIDGMVTAYCNWFRDLTAAMEQNLDGATAAIDNAQSCIEANLGCEWWQRMLVRDYSWWAGYYLSIYAGGLHDMGYIGAQQGIPVEWSTWLHNAAELYYSIAVMMQEVNQ